MQFWNSTWEAVVTITGGIIAVALLALLVSKKSDTAAVIQAGASGFANSLAVAIAPVTGAVPKPNLSYPSTGGLGDFSDISQFQLN